MIPGCHDTDYHIWPSRGRLTITTCILCLPISIVLFTSLEGLYPMLGLPLPISSCEHLEFSRFIFDIVKAKQKALSAIYPELMYSMQ